MKRSTKLLVKLGVVCSSLILLSGCFGEDEEKVAMQAEIDSLKRVNEELNESANMDISKNYASSLMTVEATGLQEYITLNGKLNFPRDMGVVDTDDDVASSMLRIGSSFVYSPSTNWVVKMDGASAHFNHPQKVWGTVKAIKVNTSASENPTSQSVLDGIDNFLAGQPIAERKDRKIYMGDYQRGYLTTGTMTVDKKKYYVNVGGLTYGDYGSLFLFAYEDNQSGVQQELIDLLITSGRMGDTYIIMQ